ncbi:MAG: S-methyl-5'-thioadenosine phosphorylase [Elusimicrobia bacterium]|nr:S-methyl-5'-thioadenosine phosphorylase [Elusimicrobiota bacterium]
MTPRAVVGIIGGSGLYDMPGLERPRQIRIKTPFGPPSAPVLVGLLRGVPCAFLARHGPGHVLLPSELNGRANIWALKSLGVERLVSISAVGSLREELAPRDFVFPNQLVDRTRGRISTFFGDGIVAHVAFDRPFCDEQSELLRARAEALGIRCHRGGTLVCMEGPAFSTKAESEYHRRMGWDLVGMTSCPEAKLAREAELCYSPVALVTDYDCWKEGEEVSSSKVVENLSHNVANAQKLLAEAATGLAARPRGCRCGQALAGAIFTDPARVGRRAARRLDLLTGRRLKRSG